MSQCLRVAGLVFASVLTLCGEQAIAQVGRNSWGTPLSITGVKAVQQAIGLDDAATSSVQNIVAEYEREDREELQSLFTVTQSLKDLGPEERNQKTKELFKKHDVAAKKRDEKSVAELQRVLTAEQFERLQQIAWQVGGSEALVGDARFVKELDLTQEQIKQITSINKEYRGKLRGLVGRAFHEAQVQRLEWDKERDAKAKELLTKEQQTKLAHLIGKPFELELLFLPPGLRRPETSVSTRPPNAPLREDAPGAWRNAGQRADPAFDASITGPAYTEKHPSVLIDEAHHNFHTASGRYKTFADLMTNDGYRVTPNKEPFTSERLARHTVLVIANALGGDGMADAKAPGSAFTQAECDGVQKWVEDGGSLLLITDHPPFGSAAQELSNRFGVEMGKLTTVDPANVSSSGGLLFSREKNQLADHPIMNGRDESEKVNRVLTFAGQSLKGPSGSFALLKFADTAMDLGPGQSVSAAGRAQGVALKHGRGRVVVMGEAAQLSAQVVGNPPQPMGMNVPGCDNRKLALNVMHWLSGLTD